MRYEIGYTKDSIYLKSNLSNTEARVTFSTPDYICISGHGLFHVRDIIRNLTDKISSDELPFVKFKNFKHESKKLKWLNQNRYKYLCKAIAAKLAEFRSTIDERVVNLHRRIFSIHQKANPGNYVAYLLANKYLYLDFMKYNCCAGLIIFDGFSIKDWKTKFANNKVCMQYNGRVTQRIIKTLCKTPEVLTYTKYLMLRELQHNNNADSLRKIFVNCTTKEITQVRKYLAEHGQVYNFRRASGIQNFAIYLSDYPETYNGTLMGLARRSVEWHRRAATGRYKTGYLPETKLPECPLNFKHDNIKQLLTVKELNEESCKMSHCVASYADYCVKGHSYIFHVEHEKEKATVEVRTGNPFYVSQSQGPFNKQNKASKWAESYFRTQIKRYTKELEKNKDTKNVVCTTMSNDCVPY